MAQSLSLKQALTRKNDQNVNNNISFVNELPLQLTSAEVLSISKNSTSGLLSALHGSVSEGNINHANGLYDQILKKNIVSSTKII